MPFSLGKMPTTSVPRLISPIGRSSGLVTGMKLARGTRTPARPIPTPSRLLRRLEFHYTPKHASWLNMAEIEIGVLRSQCLDRRIDNRQRLKREIAAWQHQRNAAGARMSGCSPPTKPR